MVERVARAMYEAAAQDLQSKYAIELDEMVDCPWEYQPERDHWYHYARAAITAMREPTEAMLDVGGDWYVEHPREDALEKWQAMIDAALADNNT